MDSTSANIQEKAALIWNAANSLSGVYKPHEYGNVILPMAIIKRFHDCLEPTREKVLQLIATNPPAHLLDNIIKSEFGLNFYNASKFNFTKLLEDSAHITENFRNYIAGFSKNVRDILDNLEFDKHIDKMSSGKNILYQVIKDFNAPNADMSNISAVDMGYIFENLVQRFSESYDEEAGSHFTSRDIIYLMCDLLVNNLQLSTNINYEIYDMAMGTSQMLTCMEERLKARCNDIHLYCYGQEINKYTFGIAQADMLIRGGDIRNLREGNTLNNDQFPSQQFDFVVSNPPFGIDWKRESDDVQKEFNQGTSGRFFPGLPPKNDGQMLFLLNGIAKLKDSGRMAIIQNGSSLFTGDAGSGPSDIRLFVVENDLLDSVIQLPNDSFYNTGIATYIWILTKSKPADRAGKVLLIDASKSCEPRRKSIGNKRVDITQEARNFITEIYDSFTEGKFKRTTESGNILFINAKILDNLSLCYNKITIESPLIGNNGKIKADPEKRDYENVPFSEDIHEFFAREVKPYSPDSWIDETKTKKGCEIPFTRTFYDYESIESSRVIAKKIIAGENELLAKIKEVFTS